MHEEGYKFILTAPLTEIIDNPGFFIQMGMASMPGWLERWGTPVGGGRGSDRAPAGAHGLPEEEERLP